MTTQPLANVTALNPFQAPRALAHTTETGSSREIAEVQAAMTIAKRFPRDQVAAMDRILQACTRQSLAESALYSYNRGGSEITGPSIRLAETLAQGWGNLQFGIREVEQRQGESTVEAFCWDLETNTRQVKVFQVPHERHTKSGKKALTDPRDIYELVANQGARRLRACILGVIPGDVTETAVQQCEVTLAAKADTGPEAVKKLIAAFDSYGVTPEMLTKRLGNRLEAIRPAQMVQFKKIYASLRDGMSGVSDWFEAVAPVSSASERLQAAASQRQEPAQGADPTDPHPTDASAAPEWPQANADGELVDVRGLPWIEGAHSDGKSCVANGEWRRKRGVDPKIVEKLEAAASDLKQRVEAAEEPETEPMSDFEKVRAGIEAAGNQDEVDEWLDYSRETIVTQSQRFALQSCAEERARAFG